jgi:DNA-binding NarL/FixJ family response regulator
MTAGPVKTPEPVTVLVVDDHPALRAGLAGLLEQEPGFACIGAVAGEAELARRLADGRPDVVVLDYALRQGDGLTTCFRLKQRSDPPGVVLYSAYADDVLAVPAAVAQADAVVSKTAPVEVLLGAIRAIAGGTAEAPSPEPEEIEAACSRLPAGDLPVVGMLFARVSVAEIARTLGTTRADVRNRALRAIGEMQAGDRVRRPATARPEAPVG